MRQLLLELGLTEADRRRVADALAHADACAECRGAFGDFDRLVGALRHGSGAGGSVGSAAAGAPEARAGEGGGKVAESGGSPDPAPSSGAPAGGWESFERRLTDAAARGPALRLTYRGSAAAPGVRRITGNAGRWLPVAAGAAASLLVAFFGFLLGRQATPVVVGPPALPTPGQGQPTATAPAGAATVVLAPADVVQRVRTFREVNQVFDGRAGWMLLSGDQSDVGLIDAPAAGPGTFPPTQPAEGAGDPRPAHPASRPAGPQGGGPGRKEVLVRLHLLRGADVVSDVDLVIVPGTTASVTVPTTDGTRLRYYVGTDASDPTRLAVRVEVSGQPPGAGDDGAGEPAVAVLGTSLHVQPYRDVAAGRLVTSAGAYDLKIAAAPSPSLASSAAEGKL